MNDDDTALLQTLRILARRLLFRKEADDHLVTPDPSRSPVCQRAGASRLSLGSAGECRARPRWRLVRGHCDFSRPPILITRPD